MDRLRDILVNSYVLRCKIRSDLTGKFSDSLFRLFHNKKTGKWWLPIEDAQRAGLDLRGRREDITIIGAFPDEHKKVIEMPVTLQIDSSIITEHIMVVFGDLLREMGYAIYMDLIARGKVKEKEEKVVAIEVESEEYCVCNNRKEAFEWGDKNFPGKLLYFHIISPRLFHIFTRGVYGL